MLAKPPSCVTCPLYGDGKGFVPADGVNALGVLIVGEAAGETEAALGKPFVGAAGSYLNRVLKRAALKREDFRVHNVLSCRPPDNKLLGMPYEEAAISHCRPNLDATIGLMRPRAIIALGGIPLRRLTGATSITRYRGFVLPGPGGSWVVPTFHPSYLLPRRGQAKTSRFVGAVAFDIKKAVQIAREGFRREEGVYVCDPPPSDFFRFVLEYEDALAKDAETYLSADIETPYKLKTPDEQALTGGDEEEEEDSEDDAAVAAAEPILRISFAFRPHYAVSVPWLPPYLPLIQRLLGSVGRKVFWNGGFDVPVLRRNGMRVEGEVVDAMWAWHFLQSDLPRGLEFVASFFTSILPWKHTSGEDPARYNAIDSDVALQILLAVEKALRANGQWNIFYRHVVQLDPVLYQMGQVHGVHIDVAEQTKLRTFLEGEKARLLAEAQHLVPDEVKPRKTLKRPREGYTPVAQSVSYRYCSLCGQLNVSKSHPCVKKGEGEVKVGWRNGFVYQTLLPFNPNSRTQLMAYMLHFGHPLGKDPRTKKDTLDKRHVEGLKKKYGAKHPIYKVALDLRLVSKTLGTYVVGFAPDAKGLVYTLYTHATSTGRLSSRAVNLQNVSARSSNPYAAQVRRTIVPTPGNYFVEADSSAIEAVMVGRLMGSEEYVARAREGIHAYLASRKLGIEFTPENVARIKNEHEQLYSQCKVTVHGTAYGMGANLMVATFPDAFPNRKAAEDLQRIFFEACPGLAEWQEQVRMLSHKQTYLVNPWGYRHYFYDVFGKDRDGTRTLNDDAKRCVAFLPQSSAAAFMKDTLLILWYEHPWVRPYLPANGSIHDSVCLDVPPHEVERAVDLLGRVMTREIAEMGGLRVGCEIKQGRNWAPFDEKTNPQGMRKVKVVTV